MAMGKMTQPTVGVEHKRSVATSFSFIRVKSHCWVVDP